MASYVERLLLTLLFDPIKHDLHLNDTEVSLLAGMAFVLFFVTAGLVVGRLTDRGNRKRLILIGVVAWSAATFCCGLARSFLQLFLGRMAVGVGESTLGPTANSIFADHFPRQRLAGALSVFSAASYVGAGAALAVGGAIISLAAHLPKITLFGPEPLHAWQLTFFISGAAGLLVLIPVLFVKEPRRRDLAPDTPGEASDALLWPFLKRRWRFFACHFGAYSISAILGMGSVAWMPSFFIRVHHWPAAQIGYVYGFVLAVVGGVAIVAGGRLIQWLEARGMADVHMRLPLIFLTASFPFGLAVVLVPDPNIAVVCLAISTFLSGIPIACISTALQLVTPNQVRGQVLALFAFVGNIVGPALGPVLIAALTDFVFRDPAAVGRSLAVATIVIAPIVSLLLWLGMAPFRAGLAHAERWRAPASS
jgi:MFS family permease